MSIIHFFYLCLFFFTPLIFTSLTSELFEVPKMYFVYFITLFILFFHLLNWLRGKVSLFSKNKLNIPLLIFFSTQLISTFFSVDVHTSIFGYYSRLNGGLLSLISYSLLAIILPLYLKKDFSQKIINTSLLAGLFVSSWGILEHFGIDKNTWVQDVQSRVFSTLGQPNWLAAYLCILLPFSLDKFLKSKIYSLKSLFFLLLVSNFYFCLLFTKSKSGIIAAVISIGIYFIFKLIQKTNFITFIPLILIFLSTSLIISNPIKDFIFPQKPLESTNQTNTLNITPSEDIRKIVWQGSLDLWKRFPLFGTGPETFAYSYYWTRPVAHNLTSEWDFLYNKAHNEYLNYLATTGTFGFVAYVFFIAALIIILSKKIFFHPLLKEERGVDFNTAIFAAFLSILITNFAGFSVVSTSLFFFLLPFFTLENNPQNSSPTPQNKYIILPLIALSLFLITKLMSLFIADIAYNKANILVEHQQFSSAQDNINFAIYLNPAEALYQSSAAIIATKLNNPELALSRSNLAMTLSPASTNLWKERAQIFSELSLQDSKYFVYAIDALEKCSRLAPTDAKVFYLLGKFYEAASQKDFAIKNYQQALNLKANYDHAAFSLGEIYFNDKKYSEAKKYFETTLQYAPTNTDAQNYLNKITSLSPKSR